MANRNVNQVKREFQEKYGTKSTQVVTLLAQGLTVAEVATRTRTPITSVRTWAGNITRGVFAPYVRVSARGQFIGTLVG